MLVKHYKGERIKFSLNKKLNSKLTGHKVVIQVGNMKFWSLWSAMQYINNKERKCTA